MQGKPLKIVYCTPAIYSSGGIERVVTLKANYLVDHYDYQVTIIVTEGQGRTSFFPLSDKIEVINYELNFEELWTVSFLKKVYLYIKKNRKYKHLLSSDLNRIRADITVSTLRREINFLTSLHDGSKKVGELHVNRHNYRNFESNGINIFKKFFSIMWMNHLINKIKKLDGFVVLTEEDRNNWSEIRNVCVIPDPLPFHYLIKSELVSKRVIAVGRYAYQKGFDLLIQAWSIIEKKVSDWSLAIYGNGDRTEYYNIMSKFGVSGERCHLYESTKDIQNEYLKSSLFVFSSRYEGFGMALVEAMSCGLPVISFACPCGPRGIISDGENGFLIEPGDIDSFSNSMLLLMTDTALRERMSEKALSSVDKYLLSSVMDKWIKLFNSLIDK